MNKMNNDIKTDSSKTTEIKLFNNDINSDYLLVSNDLSTLCITTMCNYELVSIPNT